MVGGIEKRALVLASYEPQWLQAYVEQERRIRAALGPTAIQIGHVGTAEEDYLGQLDVGYELRATSYELRVREPGHRMVRTPARDVHVHVLGVGDETADDYLLFRDRLRVDPEDRDLYERTKRALIEQDWVDVSAYDEAKPGSSPSQGTRPAVANLAAQAAPLRSLGWCLSLSPRDGRPSRQR